MKVAVVGLLVFSECFGIRATTARRVAGWGVPRLFASQAKDLDSSPSSAPVNARKQYVNVFEELSESERAEVMELAFGGDHARELPLKVAKALEEDYDVSQGVNPTSRRPLPIKANLDLILNRARNETDFAVRSELYQKCISYNPTDGRAWLGLARIFAKKGQFERAEKTFKDGLYYGPKNPFLLQAWAVMLEKQGKISDATKLLTRSIKSNPKHAASWVALARIHQRTGNLEQARYCYSCACDGDPRSYVALQAWGFLEGVAGNVALSRDLYSRASKVSGSRSAHTLQAWATLEKRQGNLDEAQRLLEAALRSNTRNSRVRTSMAELLELRGEMDAARQAYVEGERFAEGAGDAGFFQAWALFELRREVEATTVENREASSSGGGEATSNASTSAGLREGEGEGANGGRLLSGAVVREKSTKFEARQQQQEQREDRVMLPPTAVRLLFKKAVTVNKFHSASWVAWAKYEQNSGNLEVARRLLVSGIANFPHSRNIAWFHCSLGRLSCQDGDMHTARACYERALNTSPPQTSLSIWLEFARMEDLYGSVSAARRLLDGACKKFPVEDRAWDAFLDFERRHSGVRGNGGGKGSGAGGDIEVGVRVGVGAGAQKQSVVAVSVSAAGGDGGGGGKLVEALLERRALEQASALLAQQSRAVKADAAVRNVAPVSLGDLELAEGAVGGLAAGIDEGDGVDQEGSPNRNQELDAFWDSQEMVGLDALLAKARPNSAS